MIPIVPVSASVPVDSKQLWLKPGQISLPGSPPLSLYVHIPWCVRKCPYCDFNSHAAPGADNHEIPEDIYLDALRADLEQSLPLVWGRPVHTVFIGGGTPSLLSAAGMDRLLSDIRALLPLDADAEITMEANPGTFEADKFASYRASGINRLSIGIQSFNDRHLQALGRIHGGAEARKAIDIAQASFDNINLDLMYALPGQTLDECRQDVETALSYGTTHLSLYHLTLEPNTLFARFPPALPDDDSAYEMQDWIEARTAEAGYRHYETSAYAKPHREARHNLNYWRFGDYLGIGAGAHGKLSFPHRILRQMRHKHPATYMERALAGNAVQEARDVGADELPFEFMLNALRLTDGVPASSFHDYTGLPLHTISKQLAEAEKKGLLEADLTTIRPTELGRRFLNDLQEMFLKD
ncbi:oxygen-independent coproporphyrinogen-III oxidase-like protein YggW [Cupriavidus necator N-1]|jgi:oxygen-independent coproporphyrinogen-3 oxidase|uniref:Heme chaperone HemW n=1 Tax=Cupriavidus necator (strain ATCC 43291 / DSM 13513 / CCUG 52238 / LMG 8453 / N-1) TaxID=1042878 RepID=G0EYZ3_CUPNN|nr:MULTISPECIES: radical SAM family heme chaperone HemW [Cupriavidus]AEI76258.1 oxygen-independent coproporphyrinogen-III oxidase-like protein YggW [Cupriavidus necator N-1]KAI3609959.1 Oxygen-independent coproporphyrinogen-III oxidase-like protein YggW [Cupriavidus necator H850]MDX6011618.1 radical SAM family heme chaperone HemW [Cupriavidus necator]QUN29259.1 oxygen-independent coproporphyrinogen III oxidase-like protein [Cupriavidus sp. KK10]